MHVLTGEIEEVMTKCGRGVLGREGNESTGLPASAEDRCGDFKTSILEDVDEKLTVLTREMNREISNRYSSMNASMWKVLGLNFLDTNIRRVAKLSAYFASRASFPDVRSNANLFHQPIVLGPRFLK